MQLLRYNAITIQQSCQTALSEEALVDLFILNIKLHPEQKIRVPKRNIVQCIGRLETC